MPNKLLIVNTTKRTGGDYSYIGTVGDDGYIYFNDALFYRFKPIDTWEDNQYVLNNGRHTWMKSNIFTKLSYTNFNSGGGSVANVEGVEGAVQWAIDIANDPSHGYDQPTRDGGVDYDCSSLVSTAFREAGFDIPLPSPGTWQMIDAFTAAGFTWYGGTPNVGDLQRGDILLNINSHAALYTGDNMLVQASINEFGGISGGEPGDQTGTEIAEGSYYNFPWDGILRYTG